MARQGFPSDKQDQFVIRLPDGMRDRIKAAAESNNRSMNAEIVATLEEKYPAPKQQINEMITLLLSVPEMHREEYLKAVRAGLLAGNQGPMDMERVDHIMSVLGQLARVMAEYPDQFKV